MEKEDETQRLLQISEISLMLDTYDDIFSDFDPRPYAERALSIDFLEEAERASKDKASGMLEINFLIPKDKRNEGKEMTIKKRLKEHFKKHLQIFKKEKNKTIRNGIMFIGFGILFMILAVIILQQEAASITVNFLIVLLEPAGWFLFWEGLNMVIFESKKINPKLEFYEKMHKCDVNFYTY